VLVGALAGLRASSRPGHMNRRARRQAFAQEAA
jgi:hypothetical protein